MFWTWLTWSEIIWPGLCWAERNRPDWKKKALSWAKLVWGKASLVWDRVGKSWLDGVQLGWWDSQSGALFTSSSSGMTAQARWCHCHGNNSHCLRLQESDLALVTGSCSNPSKPPEIFVIIPQGMIKSYTSYAFIPPFKELRLLHRSLICAWMCVWVCINSTHRLVPVWNHACISVRVMTVCERDGSRRFASLPSPPARFPQHRRLWARCWGPGGRGPGWPDSCLNRCLTHSWGLVAGGDKTVFVFCFFCFCSLSSLRVEQRQTCYGAVWVYTLIWTCVLQKVEPDCVNVFNIVICYRNHRPKLVFLKMQFNPLNLGFSIVHGLIVWKSTVRLLLKFGI